MSKFRQLLEMGYKPEELGELDLSKIFPHETEYPEDVYAALLGHLLPEYGIPWVESIFVPGHPYDEHYGKAYDASSRLSEKLGYQDDFAPVVQDIRDGFMKCEEIVAYEMFKYGMKYQKMLDEEKLSHEKSPLG